VGRLAWPTDGVSACGTRPGEVVLGQDAEPAAPRRGCSTACRRRRTLLSNSGRAVAVRRRAGGQQRAFSSRAAWRFSRAGGPGLRNVFRHASKQPHTSATQPRSSGGRGISSGHRLSHYTPAAQSSRGSIEVVDRIRVGDLGRPPLHRTSKLQVVRPMSSRRRPKSRAHRTSISMTLDAMRSRRASDSAGPHERPWSCATEQCWRRVLIPAAPPVWSIQELRDLRGSE